MNKAEAISFNDIENIKKVFEQKGIPLDEITAVLVEGELYYMWPVEKALKHKTIDTCVSGGCMNRSSKRDE